MASAPVPIITQNGIRISMSLGIGGGGQSKGAKSPAGPRVSNSGVDVRVTDGGTDARVTP